VSHKNYSPITKSV